MSDVEAPCFSVRYFVSLDSASFEYHCPCLSLLSSFAFAFPHEKGRKGSESRSNSLCLVLSLYSTAHLLITLLEFRSSR